MLDLLLLTDSAQKANILVDAFGVARITDFGLTTILSETDTIRTSDSDTFHGTMRWMAPELLEMEEGGPSVKPTKASDIYALAMVFWEVRVLSRVYIKVLSNPPDIYWPNPV